MSIQYRRRVGTVRPSHLMFTGGVGALVDLPNFSVLVRGIDDWRYDGVPDWQPIAEPRLLAAVRMLPGMKKVEQLRPAPWLDGLDADPNGPASRVGVPVAPFPAWLRCTACNELGPINDAGVFGFENAMARRPHEARFFHANCNRKNKKPLAVAARFVLACPAGHLDEFPYRHFVHRGTSCASGAEHPRMQMDDRGGNLGANVALKCLSCEGRRNVRDALGKQGEANLPACRGRHPHLLTFDPGGCKEQVKVLVAGASNQWFSQGLAALAIPKSGAKELETKVEQHWKALADLPPAMYAWARENVPAVRDNFAAWTDEQLAEAVAFVWARLAAVADAPAEGYPDLRTPEWEALSADVLPATTEEFAARRLDDGVPEPLAEVLADVVQVERLREVRALVGFTRLDAPDPDDPDLVTRAPLARSDPAWVPASDVRGEGIFLRVPEGLLAGWEARVGDSPALACHREAYGQFRRNRYSGRITGGFDEMRHWPGARYIALHTLAHLLIRTIALDCGYSSASLSERIYAGTDDDPRAGILIYTAVPDAEGTLGGLVSQAEPDRLVPLVRRALRDARRCSSDPLCAERLPQPPADFLHGAACHVCLFVSETTCERGNRFLDRRFVVPVDDPKLALYPDLP